MKGCFVCVMLYVKLGGCDVVCEGVCDGMDGAVNGGEVSGKVELLILSCWGVLIYHGCMNGH